MGAYERIQAQLRRQPKTWLVTGAGGFIGSHLVEKLLSLGQRVVGLDNFATGRKSNLAAVRKSAGEFWRNLRFIQGDIRDLRTCRKACKEADYVLHQAALGSVPRSVEDPISTNESNVTGFLNMLVAARDCKVKRFVYASSSAVYGDDETLPKTEEKLGRPLSPYAVSKYINELYAEVFARCYNFQSVGLRYFNVFGPRQDPNGPYAAVIPRWIDALRSGKPVTIHGDGETSRDFCYIENVVQANLLAATAKDIRSLSGVYNVACNERTTLNELFSLLREALLPENPKLPRVKPKYAGFRKGDIRHSQADIEKSREMGFAPSHTIAEGLAETLGANSRAVPREAAR